MRKNYSPLQVDKGGHFSRFTLICTCTVKALVFTACAKENAEMKICWVGFETGQIVIIRIPGAIHTIIHAKSTNNSITFNRRDNQDFFSPFLLSLPLNLDAGRDSNATVNTDKVKKLLHNRQEKRGGKECNCRIQHVTRLH